VPQKIDGGWGFAPDPTAGAYSAPPEPLLDLGGRTPGKANENGKWERR